MERYSKFTSNYIRRGKHQSLRDGSTIFERNWVTIGNQLHFGPNKIPYYNHGNFVFTTSPTSTYKKKHRLGTTVGEWTYEDVKDAVSSINNIDIDQPSNDIRSFAYYGSALELFRTCVEHIIAQFPGNITLSKRKLEIPPESEIGTFEELPGYIVNNPFKIDLYHENIDLSDYDNKYRFLTYTYKDYTVNGFPIVTYDIGAWDGDIYCPQNDQWYIKQAPVITITISTTQDVFRLDGYQVEDEIVYLFDGEELTIQPNDDVIETYFRGLKGFEKMLLNRSSQPLYSNKFITPIEGSLVYHFYERTYTWPSNGYCIDISSGTYLEFITKFSNMAQLMDELCTDNLYRRMTHEAITNYDWTYSREWYDGDEEANIEGGNRMEKILRIIGRVFDDRKRYIDNIKYTNRITFNEYNNFPAANISDNLEMKGWEVYSTIPTIKMYDDEVGEYDYDTSNVQLDEETLSLNGNRWFPTRNISRVTPSTVDINFMRHLLLFSKRIFSTKGTRQSIDMIMAMFGYGENDYGITEEYYTVKPREYDEELNGSTLGDEIIRINNAKNLEHIYDDDVSGIPVASFTYSEYEDSLDKVMTTTYLIPYYTNSRIYDGDLYFQGNGGWFYNQNGDDNGEINPYGWNETLSYLHVVPKVGDLMGVNSRAITNGDIYYVFNLNDYIEYDEIIPDHLSHFFVVTNEYNPEQFSSWANLDMTDGAYADDDEFAQYMEKAKYLNGIISINFGNNPHVGYGKYDKGGKFFEYMKKPFKYSIDNFDLNYNDIDEADNDIVFDVSEPVSATNVDDKVKVINKKPYEDDYVYYLNSKVVTMENNIDNEHYKTYFKNIIMPYLMQIIPSTTIFILKNFE